MLVLHLESARRDARAAEREQGGQRRPPLQGFSQRRLLFTIAITGIAVLLGSLFFQKKTENHWNALGVGRNNLRICNSALKLCIHLSGSKSFWENATITVELIRISLIYIYIYINQERLHVIWNFLFIGWLIHFICMKYVQKPKVFLTGSGCFSSKCCLFEVVCCLLQNAKNSGWFVKQTSFTLAISESIFYLPLLIRLVDICRFCINHIGPPWKSHKKGKFFLNSRVRLSAENKYDILKFKIIDCLYVWCCDYYSYSSYLL